MKKNAFLEFPVRPVPFKRSLLAAELPILCTLDSYYGKPVKFISGMIARMIFRLNENSAYKKLHIAGSIRDS